MGLTAARQPLRDAAGLVWISREVKQRVLDLYSDLAPELEAKSHDVGIGTDIGPFGTTQTWAAAFDTDGTLYTLINGFTGNAILASVNQTTGAATTIGSGVGYRAARRYF